MLISQLFKDCIFFSLIMRLCYLIWTFCRVWVVVTSHLEQIFRNEDFNAWTFVLLWRRKMIRPIERTFQNALSRSKLSFHRNWRGFQNLSLMLGVVLIFLDDWHPIEPCANCLLTSWTRKCLNKFTGKVLMYV